MSAPMSEALFEHIMSVGGRLTHVVAPTDEMLEPALNLASSINPRPDVLRIEHGEIIERQLGSTGLHGRTKLIGHNSWAIVLREADGPEETQAASTNAARYLSQIGVPSAFVDISRPAQIAPSLL